jgi:ribosomal-protein-alanine N-acetyltransferase
MNLIETDRLITAELTMDMAEDIRENSLDEDTRRFVPDEVFETLEEARETVEYLMGRYGSSDGPLVYALLTKEGGRNVGYVQMVPLENGSWEIGYHIGKRYTGNGYATEAVRAFLPVMAEKLGIQEVAGICLKENAASCRVMQKSGFTEVFSGVGEYQGQEREIVRFIWKRGSQTESTV